MNKISKIIVLVLAVLAVAALAVGCGSGNSAGNKEQAAGSKDSKQKVVAAFEPTFAPFEFTNDKGEFTGFDIDLIKAIAKEEGFDVELRNLGFDGLIPALQAGQIDVAISGMTIKPEREKQVDFSVPYYQAGLTMAVREDNNNITKPEDLAGKTIAAQIGTTGADKANEFAQKYGAKVKTFNTTDLVFMELVNGNAAAVINDKPVTEYFMTVKGKGKVKEVGEPLTGEYYGIAVPKGNTQMLNSINDGLKKLKENGEYAKLYQKWFGTNPPAFLPGQQAK